MTRHAGGSELFNVGTTITNINVHKKLLSEKTNHLDISLNRFCIAFRVFFESPQSPRLSVKTYNIIARRFWR